jgi:hypothetical protein
MRVIVAVLGLSAVMLAPASADDQGECRTGIEMIRTEIARKPAEATLKRLQTALRVAEREQREREFDECVDAINDARKAMGR